MKFEEVILGKKEIKSIPSKDETVVLWVDEELMALFETFHIDPIWHEILDSIQPVKRLYLFCLGRF